jgi:colicin import membrane protein
VQYANSNNVMTEFSSNTLPEMAGRHPVQWQPISLAALVHVLLIVFLWVGVQWQNKESTAVEAEVWDMTTREAAPKPVYQERIEPVAEPVPAAPVKVVPKEEPLEDPEIALAQEKKRKRLEKQKQEQELARELELKLEREKALKLEKDKLAEQKKKAEKLEKAADKLAVDEAEKKKQAELAKQNAKEKAVRDKAFEENMRRLTGQASTNTNTSGVTGSGGNGDAAKSTGNNRGDPSYAAKIAAKVRSNTVFNATDNSTNNPTVEYRIDLLPDGSLRGAVRKLKSSGVPAFDDAVEKAIDKSMPFPRDKSGQVPASIVYVHRMKE